LSLWGNQVPLRGRTPHGGRIAHHGVPIRYDLAAPATFHATKAEKVALDRKMTVRAAFVALARAGLTHLTANEGAVLSGVEPEGLHQMRVAIRRLRALLAAFAPHLDAEAAAFLRGELKWLQGRLGPARDWDVFLSQTLAPLMRRLPNEPGLADIRNTALDARRQAYLVVRETLSDRRYTRFLMRFQLWLASTDLESRRFVPGGRSILPVTEFATEVLGKRYRKLMKLGERRDLAEREMHELRLRAKKLRYAVDFFRSLYRNKRARRFVKALGALQDRLGSLQDAVVGRDLVAQIDTPPFVLSQGRSAVSSARDKVSTAVRPLGRAAAMVIGFQLARIIDDVRRFKDLWSQFAELKGFWRKTV
jgi:CHAD domain-containing protein